MLSKVALIISAMLVFAPVVPNTPIAYAADDSSADQPRIGLALGSGGATGLAHIAMLEVFDDLGIRPQIITGTSIGAVIGGLYAAGLSAQQIYDLFDDFGGTTMDALSGIARHPDIGITDLVRLGMGGGGVFDSQRFLEYATRNTAVRDFSELEIPLKVVATDFYTGESVVIEQGDLFPAIEASMAVPVLFEPVEYQDKLLIDGGTSNPLPYDLLMGEVDIIVAVDVSGSRSFEANSDPGMAELLFNTIEIMQQSLVHERMRYCEPDIYLKPEVEDVRLLQFNRIEEILDQAEPAALELRRRLSQ